LAEFTGFEPYPYPEPSAELEGRHILVLSRNDGRHCKLDGEADDPDLYLWSNVLRCARRIHELPKSVTEHPLIKQDPSKAEYEWVGMDGNGELYEARWHHVHKLSVARWCFVPRSILSALGVTP